MKQKENVYLKKKDHSILVKELKTCNKKCPSKSSKIAMHEELRQRRFQTETKTNKQKKCPSKNSNAWKVR